LGRGEVEGLEAEALAGGEDGVGGFSPTEGLGVGLDGGAGRVGSRVPPGDARGSGSDSILSIA
jgi:hypothetical protein